MQAVRRRAVFDFTSRLGRRAEAGPRRVLPRVRPLCRCEGVDLDSQDSPYLESTLMHDFLSRFRFGDFAAYFLPGLAFVAATMWSLCFTPLRSFVLLPLATVTLFDAFVLGCLAYGAGAFISGSSYKLLRPMYFITRHRAFLDPRGSIQPPALAHAVGDAFTKLFGNVGIDNWSDHHFFLIRSAVNERMPHASAEGERQNDLMRLRENMLFPLLIFFFASLMFALQQGASSPVTGWTVAGVSLLFTYVALGRLVGRAADNRMREVREICAAFLTGSRLGVFSSPELGPKVRGDIPDVIRVDATPSDAVDEKLPIRTSPSS